MQIAGMRTLLFFLSFFGSGIFCAVHCDAQTWIITTYAGNGAGSYGGDSGPATLAGLVNPSGVAVDRKGNLYIADQNNQRVRKVNAAGVITTIAGIGTFGYSGDGGLADTAKISAPTGVAVDKHGNVYIADEFNNVIRKVDTNGIITTVAGNDTLGFGGDSGLAIHAMLWSPADVAVDTNDNIYIVDQDNQRIRKVDTAGIITTFAGNGTPAYGGDSGLATAAQLNYPEGIGVDKGGNVYIADLYNNRIRKVDANTGIITTVAGNGTGGYSGDDSLATNAALYDASAVAVDDSGNIYISDFYNNRIRKVTAATGIITTIAGNGIGGYSGDDSVATSAEIFHPQGVAVDDSGNVFIADYDNHVIREVTKRSTTYVRNFTFSPMQVFPNPSQGQYTIETAINKNQYSVVVYNINGLKVYESYINDVQNKIYIDDQPDGVYILYIKTDRYTSVQKLIVRH